MGRAHTVDVMIAMISTEELEEMDQIMFKQLKNRNNDVNKPKKFIVGIDRSKMKLYNIDPSELENTEEEEEEHPQPKKYQKKDISDWNI